ncbi:MAG: C10 family peptidase, partial [Prevotella sp.]|nr:C10 family peptidase [Prevotella sp.]
KDGSWINEPYTNATATAVAQLMYYCGVSVQMDYNIGSNGGSGASATDIEKALRTYFGYDETVQWLDRDAYSADNWEELVYHEISNGRPVLYAGQSTGGGHAFVCDGYRTDGFFHINWGWAGSSNDYFLLSALDPVEQGFGGSSTNTGFNSQQEAVIGIQLKGAGGTVSPAVSTASGVSLRLLSMSINENPTIIDHEITVTARITNNSKDDYNSYLGIYDLGTGYVLYANEYQIASGKTKDCDITFPASEEGTKKLDLIYYNEGYWRWGLEFEITIYPKNVTKSMNTFGWATLSSKYPLDFSETGLTPYIVTGSKGKLVEKTEITKAPGGIGLLIKGEPNQYFTIPVTLETTDDVTGNLMVPVINAEVIVTKSDDATKENYVLSVDNEGEKAVFARVNADAATVEVGKAYLTLPASTDNAPFLSFDDEEGTTGIRSLTPTLSQEEGVYTLDGRKLNGMPTAKGVYIVNGQKVVIK